MSFLEEAGARPRTAGDGFTIAVAEVTNTLDASGGARVQVQLPWLPDTQPWARVVVSAAGSNRGTYVMPHTGDEVLVAFNRSDVTDCFVVGSLWSVADPPPRTKPLDPVTTIALVTEAGHEIELDDLEQTLTVTTSTGQKVELSPSSISLSTSGGSASVTLSQSGEVSIKAKSKVSIEAPQVQVNGLATTTVEGGQGVTVKGGTSCTVKAPTIFLN